jgi:phage replication O-like protein O
MKDKYTKIPNKILDNSHLYTPAEFKVLLAICRKIYGWHKKEDRISYSQITKMTGLSISGVIKSLDKLVDMGAITREKLKNGYKYTIPLSDTAILLSSIEVYHSVVPQKKKETKDKDIIYTTKPFGCTMKSKPKTSHKRKFCKAVHKYHYCPKNEEFCKNQYNELVRIVISHCKQNRIMGAEKPLWEFQRTSPYSAMYTKFLESLNKDSFQALVKKCEPAEVNKDGQDFMRNLLTF